MQLFGIILGNSITVDGEILMSKVKDKKLEKVYNLFLESIYTKGSFYKVRKMVQESSNLTMEIFMKGNGSKD